MEIQLIIKASSQNIDDHVVDCNMNWTIEQLKNHLKDSYPNNPETKDQKLIYSGRLLSNHLQLKDILRQEEDQLPVHTFHLVCNSIPYQNQNASSSQNQNNSTNQISTETVNPTQLSENVLRYRNRTLPPTSLVLPQINQDFAQAPLLPEAQMAAQMAAMQQMYSYYFAQYMQSAGPSQPGTAPIVAPQPQLQVAQEQQQPLGAAEGVEEGEGGRDWLDQAFSFARVLMLFFLVYVYSTPERMMMVLAAVLLIFLYHDGWFARRRPPDAQPDIPEQIDMNRAERDEALDEHELAAAMDGDDPPHARPDTPSGDPPFRPLALIATFFTSLFPEPPPHLNIN